MTNSRHLLGKNMQDSIFEDFPGQFKQEQANRNRKEVETESAHVVKHVKRMPQRFLLAWSPLGRRVTIGTGPNVSTPTCVKGGPGSRRSLR